MQKLTNKRWNLISRVIGDRERTNWQLLLFHRKRNMNFKITKSFNYFQATGKNEIRHQSNKQINRQTERRKKTNRLILILIKTQSKAFVCEASWSKNKSRMCIFTDFERNYLFFYFLFLLKNWFCFSAGWMWCMRGKIHQLQLERKASSQFTNTKIMYFSTWKSIS